MRKLIYVIAILLASCYDDKGNYDYKDVNTLNVTMDDVYTVRLDRDTVITITPRLSQTLQDNEENLKYTWIHSDINYNFYNLALIYGTDLDTVGTEKTLRFHVDPSAGNLKYKHYFRVNVYDESTGLEYPVNTTLQLTKPYDGAWMILHSKNSQTELGSVEYIGGDIVVEDEAYFKSSGKRLVGKPLCLGQYTTVVKYYGYGTWNMFYVLTDVPDEAGVYCQWERFAKKDSLSRMVAPMAKPGFDFQRIKLMDGDGSACAFLLSEGGVFYQTPRAGKFYKPAYELEGDVKFTLASKLMNTVLLYDEAGHRFAYYYNTDDSGMLYYDPLRFNEGWENWDAITLIPIRDGSTVMIDPNNLPADQKVLYVGTGYQFDFSGTGVYGYALATSGDKCFVYEFNLKGLISSAAAAFNAYYQINLPESLDESTCFASTPSYNGIIFYASGNTVYRLDFKQAGGKATPVYTHPGGKAAKMKFAKRSIPSGDLFAAYQFDVSRSLGVSFDMGNGKSEFVVLNLSLTGGIGSDSEDYPATQVYSDFGEIVDFVFI
ncbi:PKD-like family lipoprotein [Butyricimonas sp.]|uniref:PKD-like family lipoprotein n=1 Tax=Butyricimonas sp. TaxID=1969738 RepID=UPI0025BFDAAF|nr:PKD-like family lipoprotein [Butyricimonas sp.]